MRIVPAPFNPENQLALVQQLRFEQLLKRETSIRSVMHASITNCHSMQDNSTGELLVVLVHCMSDV